MTVDAQQPDIDIERPDMSADLEFDCPRCHKQATDAFYGPCMSCRRELSALHGGDKRDVQAPEYEPKMNVVPNQIASKE